MARPLRLELAGGIHHVTARSNAGATLFHDDLDRLRFFDCLAEVIRRHDWFSLAYCVMGTHFHLLVETPGANLAHGMRDLNGSFARSWNDRRRSHGHVFGGRYFSKLVQEDAYLLQAARYIARNPVEAEVCSHPGAWPWSSYRATCAGSGSPVLHPERLLGYFEGSALEQRERYRRFVDPDDGPEYARADIGVFGDVDFAREHVPPSRPSPAIPRRFSASRRLPLDQVLASAPRDEAVAAAHLVHGYLLNEIGAELGVHPSTVSRWIRSRARDWT